MTHGAHEAFAAFVGIDWADATHDGCLQTAASTQRAYCQLEHTPAAIDAWVTTLRTRFNGQPVALCLALHNGPLVSALRPYDFLVLFPINPLMLARYRDAFTPSRATDDPTDAALQLALLRTHRDTLQPLRPQSPTLRALAPLVAHRRRVVGDNVRLTNRLTRTLKNSFPHVLHGFQDKDPVIFCAFLRRWPTRKAAQRARRATLDTFFRAQHVRSAEVIAQRLQAIKAATPRTTDDGVSAPNALLGQALIAQLRTTVQAIADVDSASAPRAQSHPDCSLFQALPGAGPVFAPRLLVAFGAQRARSPAAAALQKDAGMAPGTARSGKKSWGHWRLQCPKFVRQTFVEWAAASIRHAFWAGVFYQQQRNKGKAHQAAVRALACTWIRILSRCWQDRTPYDEAVSLQALNNRGASLLQNLVHQS
jgi:transposase